MSCYKFSTWQRGPPRAATAVKVDASYRLADVDLRAPPATLFNSTCSSKTSTSPSDLTEVEMQQGGAVHTRSIDEPIMHKNVVYALTATTHLA